MRNYTLIKNLSFTGLGLSIEWFDFALYFALNKYWVDIFFHGYSLAVAQIYILIIYLIAYVGRWLGGAFLATLTDRYGRKKIFIISSLLMTGSSVLMALFPASLLPQTASIVLFACVRFIQGFSVGGEQPGGLTFMFEHAKKKYQTTTLAITDCVASTGMALASLSALILTMCLSHQQIITFGWHLPYIITAIAGVIVALLRRQATETDAFVNIGSSKARNPLQFIFRHEKYRIILCALILVIFNLIDKLIISGNILFIEYYHFHEAQLLRVAFIGTIISNIVQIGCCFIIDYSKKIRTCIFFVLALTIFFVIPYFYQLAFHAASSYLLLFVMENIAHSVAAFGVITYLGRYSRTEYRTSMITVYYNTSLLISVGLLLLLTSWINHMHSIHSLPMILWGLSLVSMVSFYLLYKLDKKQESKSLASTNYGMPASQL